MEIRYKKLSELAQTPYKKYEVDAGFDLYTTRRKTTDKYIEYGTDIAFEIPEGYVGLLFPRSSITKMDFILKNSVGVIDASYRGEIVFRFSNNFSELAENYTHEGQYIIDFKTQLLRKPDQFEVGERCGQIVFLEIPKITLLETNGLSETIRGSNGFGHTGRK